jgi:flagellar protein FlgJ
MANNTHLLHPSLAATPLKPLHPQAEALTVAPAAAIPLAGGQKTDPLVEKATKAAVEFESFFIGHMLHQMRESARGLAPEDSPTNNKVNQDMVDMVDGMLAKQLAGRRAFGVADAILKQILPTGFNKGD